nr:hypothetical protein CFP56_46504 [Quercus suber]
MIGWDFEFPIVVVEFETTASFNVSINEESIPQNSVSITDVTFACTVANVSCTISLPSPSVEAATPGLIGNKLGVDTLDTESLFGKESISYGNIFSNLLVSEFARSPSLMSSPPFSLVSVSMSVRITFVGSLTGFTHYRFRLCPSFLLFV